MMYLDLDELESVFKISPLWSDKAWRPARFKRSDFLGDPDTPLGDAVRLRIKQETGVIHSGPVRVLTNLRYFGFIINPITCYYCFDDKEKLQFIVTEVTNTPWKERVSYVLRCNPEKNYQHIRFDKQMHVSPFNPMKMTYLLRNNQPSDRLSLHLECEHQSNLQVDATLALKRREITARNLHKILFSFPFMTIKVAFAIYWQALRLWLKRVPVHDHPTASPKTEKQYNH